MTEQNNILVSICCESFNHAPYLRDCLEGFVMQKTNFKFEILVHDDASTDGSDDIIREYAAKYPDLFKPILQTENQYSKGISIWNSIQFPRAKGKYIAHCEGDDYWIDPLKLQKQVDFLESHPDYSMCFGNAIEHWEDGSSPDKPMVDLNHSDVSPLELFGRWQAPTASILYCKRILESNIYKRCVRIPKRAFGDLIVGICCGFVGKIHYDNKCMSVYRRLPTGAADLISRNPWPHIRTRMRLAKIYGKEYVKIDREYASLYFIRALKRPLDFFPNNIILILNLLLYCPISSLKELKWIGRSLKNKIIASTHN